MNTVSASEAKTHLARLLRAAGRGETVIITRHGKPVAQLGPILDPRRGDDIADAIKELEALRRSLPKVSIEEILAWRHEDHKY